jgi:hypothetical protein
VPELIFECLHEEKFKDRFMKLKIEPNGMFCRVIDSEYIFLIMIKKDRINK